MSEVQRYNLRETGGIGTKLAEAEHGFLMRVTDHERALAAANARIAELEADVAILRKARGLAEDELARLIERINALADEAETRPIRVVSAADLRKLTEVKS